MRPSFVSGPDVLLTLYAIYTMQGLQRRQARAANGRCAPTSAAPPRVRPFAPHTAGSAPPATTIPYDSLHHRPHRCRSSAASGAATAEQPQAASSASASLLPPSLTWPARSHGAGTLRPEHEGTRVTVCGWVDRNRDMGGVQFFDVRDHTGLLQVRLRYTQQNAHKPNSVGAH